MAHSLILLLGELGKKVGDNFNLAMDSVRVVF